MKRVLVVLAATVAGCGGDEGTSDAALDGAVDVDGMADLDAMVVVDAASADAQTGPVALADIVHEAPGAESNGDPQRAANGVRGGGASMGGFDVYSLGLTPGVNDSITLRWSAGDAKNGAGDDLAVFENAFAVSGGVFMDLVIVEVSRDGTTWRPIAHDYVTADETAYVRDPAAWHGFAGRTPVLLHAQDNAVDPFDRTLAGGDGFDLDDVVGTDAAAMELRAQGARYIRLVSASARTNPDTGAAYVKETVSNGGDIDGVYGRYVSPP
ncbi:MAG TPA: LIC_13355 family lipoprotein [Kofleriaceae bacterium]|nr:LIC_13355 family lipoprotein [Kofleriaceae bacterium]